MGIVAQSIARLRYKVPRVSPVRSPARQAPSAEYRFDTDECRRQAQSLTRQSLDQAELIALCLSLLADCHSEDEKHGLHAQDP